MVPVQEQVFDDVARQLDPSQREAFRRSLTSPLSLIQGPPGTGKTKVSAALAEAVGSRRSESFCGR
jgi:MoxR-like ATPase